MILCMFARFFCVYVCIKTQGDKNTHADKQHEQSENWRLEKNGDSGTKTFILKYCRCTTYCKHLATAGEMTQQK